MNIRLVCIWFVCLVFQACFHPVFAIPNSFDWRITKTEWSAADEAAFQDFVIRIGTAIESRQCATVTQCLNSSANIYRSTDPAGLLYKSDCADFPYFLRAYFAWKNELPFAFTDEVDFRDPAHEANPPDLRYSRHGNKVVDRYSLASRTNSFKNASIVLNTLIPDTASSANFRMHYADSNTDTYPVQVTRRSVRPGTMIYDPNGHVAMVYKVTDEGKVLYVDAHPDNSVTSGTFGVRFVRSHPSQGAGFKNWRPVKLVGAQQASDGTYRGGQMVLAANEDLADYSYEQFFGNSANRPSDDHWSDGRFTILGHEVTFYEFIRERLTTSVVMVDPIAEFKSLIRDVCNALKDRVPAVQSAIQNGMQTKAHPERLPLNIYGASGEWEEYSTPGRDAQLKVQFNDLILQSADLMRRWKAGDSRLSYQGTDLATDLEDAYSNEAMSCRLAYVNSQGRSVGLNLEEIRMRLFKLSFDPYHCIEHRWGAVTSAELASCTDGQNKNLWYEREQRLRNQHIRQYEHRMDFTLDELLQPFPGNGTDTPPDVDVVKFLETTRD